MENEYRFKVDLIPVYINSANTDPLEKYRHIMSDHAVLCISKIYNEINKRLLTSKNHAVIDRIHNGVFGCCFRTGMAIFTIRLNTAGGQSAVVLSGYFIPESCLRTAWKVFRREIIIICIGGTDSLEDKIITRYDSDIFDTAEKIMAGLDAELRSKAAAITEKMESAPVPYSFAFTDFPLKYLPVMFESSSESHMDIADGAEADKIIFTVEQVKRKEADIFPFYPDAENMYLMANSRKVYINMQKEEYRDTLSKPECKAKSKELDIRADIQRDVLWFFAKKTDVTYISLVSGDEYTQPLDRGNFEFSYIPVLLKQANIDIDRRRYERATSAPDDGKKGGGLFSGWSHKKK